MRASSSFSTCIRFQDQCPFASSVTFAVKRPQKPKRRGRFSSPLLARQAGALAPDPGYKITAYAFTQKLSSTFKRCATSLVQMEAHFNIH